MLFHIDENDPSPLYQQIVDEVRRALVVGTLRSEDALPSVRQLSTELRVNPTTVQQAYRELERAGLVYVRRGQGTYVAQQAVNGRAEAERRALAEAVALRALRDARRHGLEQEELVDAIRRAGTGGAGAANPEEGGR